MLNAQTKPTNCHAVFNGYKSNLFFDRNLDFMKFKYTIYKQSVQIIQTQGLRKIKISI